MNAAERTAILALFWGSTLYIAAPEFGGRGLGAAMMLIGSLILFLTSTED